MFVAERQYSSNGLGQGQDYGNSSSYFWGIIEMKFRDKIQNLWESTASRGQQQELTWISLHHSKNLSFQTEDKGGQKTRLATGFFLEMSFSPC